MLVATGMALKLNMFVKNENVPGNCEHSKMHKYFHTFLVTGNFPKTSCISRTGKSILLQNQVYYFFLFISRCPVHRAGWG